jgi:hypothetical protein
MNELQHRVLKMLLFGDDPVLTALRLPLESAEVSDRKFTGAGFFTEFHVPLGIPLLPGKQSFVIGDVSGQVSGQGCGFLLFVKNNALDFLEGQVWGIGDWPESSQIESLRYTRHSPPGGPNLIETEDRDVQAVRAIRYE